MIMLGIHFLGLSLKSKSKMKLKALEILTVVTGKMCQLLATSCKSIKKIQNQFQMLLKSIINARIAEVFTVLHANQQFLLNTGHQNLATHHSN
jgi:hypothetical protein